MTMDTVTSADGTTIAYEATGTGPAVVLVDGALCHRDFGPAAPLAKRLADRFAVTSYDRRGRGDSSDTAPYDVEREVEDLAAVIDAVGGSAFVYGISSGAALALQAAHRGVPMRKLAVYEAPFLVDDSGPEDPDDYLPNLTRALAEDRRGDAVSMFMRLVGAPAFAIGFMKVTPAWRKCKAVAHTLPYDHALLAHARSRRPLPADRYADAGMPVLSMAGGKSPEWMRAAMRQVAEAVPHGEYRTVEGQTHMLKPDAIAPVLADFYR
jgi:pimeloyl-ACP methyl ester carboxylesterase